MSSVGGETFALLSSLTGGYAFSDNGRYVIFVGRLAGGRDGAFLLDRGA